MEILALKWNNHQTVFSHQISELRKKSEYTDATIACHGKFYQVHRLVLSTCSEYFSAIFNQTPCKNPVIVLKDINCRDLEFLLDYMYSGEVNVRQNELSSLIGAAENLQIKGLAISDEEPTPSEEFKLKSNKRSEEFPDRSNKYEASKSQGFKSNSEVKSSPKSKGPSSKIREVLNSFCSNKDLENSLDVGANTRTQSETQPYVSDIKTEPGVTSCNYESRLMDDPCTSKTDSMNCSQDQSSMNYQLFSNDSDFPDDISDTSSYKEKSLSNFAFIDQTDGKFSSALQHNKDSLQPMGLVSPLLQDESCSAGPLALDSHDLLPQGPFLQLPLSGVMGKLSRRESDKGSLARKDYVCSFCGRTFSHRTNQLAHERIHTGEKPFRCLYCPFRTALKGNLKNHIFSRHHADWKAIKHLIFPSKDS